MRLVVVSALTALALAACGPSAARRIPPPRPRRAPATSCESRPLHRLRRRRTAAGAEAAAARGRLRRSEQGRRRISASPTPRAGARRASRTASRSTSTAAIPKKASSPRSRKTRCWAPARPTRRTNTNIATTRSIRARTTTTTSRAISTQGAHEKFTPTFHARQSAARAAARGATRPVSRLTRRCDRRPGRASALEGGGDRRGALFVAGQALLWLAYYGDGAKRLIGDEQSYQSFALAILGGGSVDAEHDLAAVAAAVARGDLCGRRRAHRRRAARADACCSSAARCCCARSGAASMAACARRTSRPHCSCSNPANAAYAHWLWPEVPHLFLVLLVFWLLLALAGLAHRSRPRPVSAPGSRCLPRVCSPAFWPLFLIAFSARGRPRFRASCPPHFFVWASRSQPAPALWHGWREYGRPMIADSSMYNLWVGLTDRWRVDYVDDRAARRSPQFLASGDDAGASATRSTAQKVERFRRRARRRRVSRPISSAASIFVSSARKRRSSRSCRAPRAPDIFPSIDVAGAYAHADARRTMSSTC